MKKIKIVYMLLFFAICLVPSLGLMFSDTEESTEHQELAEAPGLKNHNGWNLDFLEEAGHYFEEHFAFRNELVTANALLSGKCFHTSTDDTVIVGEDNWLYYKDSLNDYQGNELMTDRQLFDVAHTMSMVQDYAENQGVSFAFAIAPNKNSLYGNHMPYYFSHFRNLDSNLSRIAAYLKAEDVNYVDLYSTLEEQSEVLYHKRDSHWNNKGAAIAADAILTDLDKKHISYADRKYEVRCDFTGDLDEMLYPAAVTLENEIYYSPEPAFTYAGEVESNFDPKINTHSEQGTGSLVMYRDSFGNTLLPYFAEAYGTSYFSRGVPYQLTDLLTYNADTLVIERAERFLPDMLQNAPVMAAPILMPEELGDAVPSQTITNLRIENIGIYTKISGTLPAKGLQTDTRIAICVNGILHYEAFPVNTDDGGEGFELYLITETLDAEDNTYELLLFE